ncbi:nucleoside triphosphate pyrophosphohydrolase family protein [Patescibacteria group bacterium]
MTFEEYQKESKKTALYPSIGKSYVYPTLGLANEAGEVAGKVKKIFRDNEGKLDEERKEMLKKELGDVLWYLSQVATELDLTLDEIAKYNLDKLFSRLDRGTIQGDGDDR